MRTIPSPPQKLKMFRGPLPRKKQPSAVAFWFGYFRASCKVSKLWHAMRHGKQRQRKTRSQKAEEEGAQAGTEPPGHNLRQQTYGPFVAAGAPSSRGNVIS